MPTARSRPNSRVRSKIESAKVLAIPSSAMNTARAEECVDEVEHHVDLRRLRSLVLRTILHVRLRVRVGHRGDGRASLIGADTVGEGHVDLRVEVVSNVGVESGEADEVLLRHVDLGEDCGQRELLRTGLGELHRHRVADLPSVRLGRVVERRRSAWHRDRRTNPATMPKSVIFCIAIGSALVNNAGVPFTCAGAMRRPLTASSSGSAFS